MRTTFRNLFVAMCAFALAAMGMISCKNGEEGEPPIEDKYNAAAVNYGVAVEDYDVNLYTLTLAEKSLDIDAAGNVLDGDGKVIVVQFLSNSENEPAEGDYEVRDDATESLEDFSILPGSATSSGVSGSCVLDYADGQLTSLDQVLAAPIEGEGSMSLKKTDKGWRIIVKFINLEGEEEEYAYEGALEFISALEAAFIDEPDDMAPSVSSFDYALFASYGSGMNIIQLATADNTSLLNLLILDTSVAAAADCYGKSYTIDLSMGDGTILGCGSDVSMNYSCLYVDVTLDSYDELQIAANFKNPLMPSIASQADAMVKIASVVPEFAATEVFWEQLGFGEDMRQKVVQQMGANANQRALLSLMGGASSTPTQAVE